MTKCNCTHEAGDSDCAAHPTCPDCGADLDGIRLAADLRRLRAENERLARENSVILDGQAALKSDLELATERAAEADAFSDLVDAVLDADIMSLPDEVRVARLRLLAMDGESPLRKEQP